MTNAEMTRLCAEAIGWELFEEDGSLWEKAGLIVYAPLHNDAQAMALVKKLRLCVEPSMPEGWHASLPGTKFFHKSYAHGLDLNRAIVECVAKMETSK